ncbi:MAG: AAA family ATPase [Bacteroidota bacterium]
MVLEIRVANFFSIKDEIILDFRAGSTKSEKARSLEGNTFNFDDIHVLKTLAIYGANASGKSNIIKAIRFCNAMIFESHLHNENTKYNFKPFKFDGCSKKPSTYFIKFVMKGIEYDYSFCMVKNDLLKESLYYYPNGRRAKIFERDERKGRSKKQVYSFTPGVIKRPMDVANNTSSKTLYVSRASQMDRDIPKAMFRYFNEKFILSYLNYSVAHASTLIDQYKDKLLIGLQLADSDIVDFKSKKVSKKGKNLRADFVTDEAYIEDQNIDNLEIKTFHSPSPNTPFDFLEESDGTKKLFFVLLTVLDIVTNDKILLVDEIEASLHPKIIDYILDIFHSSKGAQLIFSTHNTSLLDLSKLRRDQVWFVNKRNNGSTDLYSLYEFSDFRDTMNLEKAYLQGRFDAVPIMTSTAEELEELIN